MNSVAGGRGARNDGRLRGQPVATELKVTHADLSARDGAPADALEPRMPLDVRDAAAQVAESPGQVGREQSLRWLPRARSVLPHLDQVLGDLIDVRREEDATAHDLLVDQERVVVVEGRAAASVKYQSRCTY